MGKIREKEQARVSKILNGQSDLQCLRSDVGWKEVDFWVSFSNL